MRQLSRAPLQAAILGYPLGHSLSPKIYQWLSNALNRPFGYHRIEVKPSELGETVRVLKRTGLLCGWNLTLPHKKGVIPYLDELDLTARHYGAVNLVTLSEGKWIGANTDCVGIENTLEEFGLTRAALVGKAVVVYGTGGAATSAIRWLALCGVGQLVLVARDLGMARRLTREAAALAPKATKFLVIPWSGEENSLTQVERQALGDSVLWLNATPLGMEGFQTPKGFRFPFLSKLGKPGSLAFDMVYRPLNTVFLKQAGRRKMKLADGLHMLIWQCLKNWELWNGPLKRDSAKRRSALKRRLYAAIQKELLT